MAYSDMCCRNHRLKHMLIKQKLFCLISFALNRSQIPCSGACYLCWRLLREILPMNTMQDNFEIIYKKGLWGEFERIILFDFIKTYCLDTCSGATVLLDWFSFTLYIMSMTKCMMESPVGDFPHNKLFLDLTSWPLWFSHLLLAFLLLNMRGKATSFNSCACDNAGFLLSQLGNDGAQGEKGIFPLFCCLLSFSVLHWCAVRLGGNILCETKGYSKCEKSRQAYKWTRSSNAILSLRIRGSKELTVTCIELITFSLFTNPCGHGSANYLRRCLILSFWRVSQILMLKINFFSLRAL